MKLGEPGKETGRQRALTKLCFFIATGRNAMVVVICAVISYVFKSNGQTPFVLTGIKINSSLTYLAFNLGRWIVRWVYGLLDGWVDGRIYGLVVAVNALVWVAVSRQTTKVGGI
jgi:hypothetical protein